MEDPKAQQLPSLRRQNDHLQRMTKINPRFIHCCFNNCLAFTGPYADESECPRCGETRYVDDVEATRNVEGRRKPRKPQPRKPRKTFLYIPLIDRLKLQYRNATRAKALVGYRKSLLERQQAAGQEELADFFDGNLFTSFHMGKLRLFQDPHDIALHMSLDGVQLTNLRHHEVTPVIFMNLNLPPEERYKVKNILAGLVIPGPKKPEDLDSFLRPLVDELLELDKGVDAWDGHSMTPFNLKAWVTMVTGDGPALADAIGMKRPGNALRPCRTCEIRAEMGKTHYYVPHSNYNFESPPLRKRLRNTIKLVEDADSEDSKKLTGITRSSILLELRSLHFPRSFPADIMHLVLQNVAPTLYQLWTQKKLPIDKRSHPNFTPQAYHLGNASINEIGASMVGARKDLPTYLCHTPRRIDNHHKGFKAAEWEAWVKLFGVPLLDQRLDDSCVDNFRLLSCIYSLSTQLSLRDSEVDILDDLVVRFVQSYEDIYYHRDPQRISVCSVNVHYLLHFPMYIRDCGPARYWWQFPMERFCGILKPKARSKSQMNLSLANGLVTTECLNHLQLSRLGPTPPPTAYPILVAKYDGKLSPRQRSSLAEQYGRIDAAYFYKRCQIRDDLTIGSVKSQRRGDITRSSTRICYSRAEDSQMAFGIVKCFVEAKDRSHQIRKLAWIQKLEGINLGHAKRICTYRHKRGHCWIEAEQIRSLIGLVRDGGVKHIVTDIHLFDYG
jgi:Transposase family tnp2/Domain of unknown function (DUF4218)